MISYWVNNLTVMICTRRKHVEWNLKFKEFGNILQGFLRGMRTRNSQVGGLVFVCHKTVSTFFFLNYNYCLLLLCLLFSKLSWRNLNCICQFDQFYVISNCLRKSWDVLCFMRESWLKSRSNLANRIRIEILNLKIFLIWKFRLWTIQIV